MPRLIRRTNAEVSGGEAARSAILCRTVGSAYVGSNPTPATHCGTAPDLGDQGWGRSCMASSFPAVPDLAGYLWNHRGTEPDVVRHSVHPPELLLPSCLILSGVVCGRRTRSAGPATARASEAACRVYAVQRDTSQSRIVPTCARRFRSQPDNPLPVPRTRT